MASTIGDLEKFTGREDFELYVERLEQFMIAHDFEKLTLLDDDSNGAEVTSRDTKRRAVFISQLGAEAYSTLRNLVAPNKPTDKTYEELAKLMTDHYCPASSEAVIRYQFHERKQTAGESIAEYVAQLRKITE